MNIKPIGVEEWLNELETSATLDIAQSTIASLTTDEILALADDEQGGPGMGAKAFYDQLGAKKQNYGWIEGSPAFKQGVAALYQGVDGRGIDPRNVLQMNGATGANLAVLYTLVNPGDHVVAEYPTYQPLYEIPRTLGAKVDLWRIHEEDGWQPRIEELERLVNRDTKLICINNASNPTGNRPDSPQRWRLCAFGRGVPAARRCRLLLQYRRRVRARHSDQQPLQDLFRAGHPYRLDRMRRRACRSPAHVPGLQPYLRRGLQRRHGTCCVIVTRFWRATATSCSATALSCRNGSMASRARAGCRRAGCPRRSSVWIFLWTMRRFAESCSRRAACCWFPAAVLSCRAERAWAIALKRRRCAVVWTSFPVRCASWISGCW